MSDSRSDPPQAAPAATSLSETVDGAIRRLSTALVVAAAIVGLAVYARPAPPRYQAFAAGSQVVRIDTRTGSMIGCEGQECAIIVRRNQSIPRKAKALPKPAAATPLPAAPAAEK